MNDYETLQNQIEELRYYRDNEIKDPAAKEIVNQRIIQINKQQSRIFTQQNKEIYGNRQTAH
jgi:hypothetical protein